MIKIGEIDRWLRLKPSSSLMLSGYDARTIRLDVNCRDKARLYLTDQTTGEETFLATVTGLDRVEFVKAGNVCITTPDEDVFVFTSEVEETHLHFDHQDVYTRIAERAARNTDLEIILARQAENFERRFNQMAVDFENRLAYQAAGQAHYEPEGVAPAPQPESKPNGDEGAPAGDNE